MGHWVYKPVRETNGKFIHLPQSPAIVVESIWAPTQRPLIKTPYGTTVMKL